MERINKSITVYFSDIETFGSASVYTMYYKYDMMNPLWYYKCDLMNPLNAFQLNITWVCRFPCSRRLCFVASRCPPTHAVDWSPAASPHATSSHLQVYKQYRWTSQVFRCLQLADFNAPLSFCGTDLKYFSCPDLDSTRIRVDISGQLHSFFRMQSRSREVTSYS